MAGASRGCNRGAFKRIYWEYAKRTCPSAWLNDPVAQLLPCRDHPVIVRDKRRQLMIELLCRGEVNGIQRSKLRRVEGSCGIQDAIVDANKIQPLKHAAPSGDRLVARWQECAYYFRACEGTGYQGSPAPKVPTQRS
jgi:hypothetical protein